jgi:hypothetical protein
MKIVRLIACYLSPPPNLPNHGKLNRNLTGQHLTTRHPSLAARRETGEAWQPLTRKMSAG